MPNKKLTKAQISAYARQIGAPSARKAALASWAHLTPEQRSARARNASMAAKLARDKRAKGLDK
jgi:hypothetical protein